MELHNLKPAKGATHSRKRIARGEGSGHGGSATKGHKGQKARSGGFKGKLAFEGGQTPMARRLPKLGFKNISRIEYTVYNVQQLEHYASAYGLTEVNVENFNANRLCSKSAKIKILGNGDLKSKLNVKVHACSASAQEKIKAAGGSIELIQK